MINLMPRKGGGGASIVYLYISFALLIGTAGMGVFCYIQNGKVVRMEKLHNRAKSKLDNALSTIERLQSGTISFEREQELNSEILSLEDQISKLKELLQAEGKLPTDLADIKLTGILQGGDCPLAIINGRIVGMGEQIFGSDMQLLAIGDEAVIIGKKGERKILRLEKDQLGRDVEGQINLENSASEESIKNEIIRYSYLIGLDPVISLSVAEVESGFDSGAVSPKGACGVFQIMPSLASDFGYTSGDMFDPSICIPLGIKVLKDYIDYFGELDLALAAYNAGFNRVIRNGLKVPDIKETREYIAKVKKAMEETYG
ncbi:lytic transglycosylase domain-containing protein [bacterium]|nr:lytic transglycosylase domain-containing protein [bacterium]